MTITDGSRQHAVPAPEMPKAHSSDFCPASRHGDANAYNTGCRCPDARADATRRRTRHTMRVLAGEPARVDATGTRRRIRALIANGWPRPVLAAELGVTVTAFDCYSRRSRVLASTAARVAALYERLADQQGPSDHARAQARARGWLAPLWWDDDTIDDPAHTPRTRETPRPRKTDIDPVKVTRATEGSDVDLTRAERLAAVQQLRGDGHGYHAIAQLLHVAVRQVHRDLNDLGLTTATAGAA